MGNPAWADMASRQALTESALQGRYTARYLFAMALIALTIGVGAYQLNRVLDVNHQQAEIINIASAQRMLSQRLALLPDRILDETNAYRRDRALTDLRLSVQRMRDGHRFLNESVNGRPTPSDASAALSHHYSPAGGGLRSMSESFIQTFESFAENPDTFSEALGFQRMNAETGLLVGLDQAVELYTEAAEAEMAKAMRVHGFWVITSLVLLVLLILFIFRPMAKDAATSMANMGAALDERAALLSRSLKIAKMGHWHATNADADPLWMSQELLDLYGMDRREGFHPLSIIQAGDIVPDETPIADNTQHLAFKRTWETGKPTVARSQFRKPNGDIIDMLVHMEPEFDASGDVIGVVGVIKDDTAEAEADRALLRSYEVIERKTQDLVEAQRLGKLAAWRCPLETHIVEWDERAYEMMRCDPETFEPTVENVRQFYIDGGRERLVELSEKVIATGQRQSDTFRVQCGDGTVIDLYLRSTLECDASGNPVALFGTMQDVTKERSAARELEQLAYYDHLTGLANRTLFTRELERQSELAAKNGHCAALILLDLDHFKEVNDTLGHQAGDQLLGIVGQRLASLVSKRNFVARLGGDEFAVIVQDEVDSGALDAFCGRIIETLSIPAALSLGKVQTNASIGIALMPDHSTEPDELMRFADLALYASKEKGRGRASYYQDDYSVALGERLSLASEIRTALHDERFEVHYQPLVDLGTGKVAAFESLLRLPKTDGGFIPPTEFIPIAESSHLIADLGSFVLHQACKEAQSWVDAGLPPRKIAVNVSAAQVWHGDLEKIIDSALEASALNPELLCVELTESVFAAESLNRLEGILSRLKQRGIDLALDDFGTGYSSLGYLNRLPFDKLKIDRTFVCGANSCAEKRKLLRGIVSLGKGLDLQVIAEGVETKDELQLVKTLGCDLVQGWYFSKAQAGDQAVIEASRIEASNTLQPANAAEQQRRHRNVVMNALIRRTGTAG